MISYGQVAGRKQPNLQTLHDPRNPKPSRYAPKRKTEKSEPDDEFEHGTWVGYKRHGCRCFECVDFAREYKRRWKAEHRAAELASGVAKCRVCGATKPFAEFPRWERRSNPYKYVCSECRP